MSVTERMLQKLREANPTPTRIVISKEDNAALMAELGPLMTPENEPHDLPTGVRMVEIVVEGVAS